MRALVVAGGDFSPELLPPRGADDLLIAADSGLGHLRALGLTPDLCVGDWDSLGAPPQETVDCVTLPVAKDDTDLVAAARIALERGCREFVLLGALGGRRFSHSFAAVQTLHWLAEQDAVARVLDARCTLTVLTPALPPLRFPAGQGGHLSLFALTARACARLEGLWYSFERLELHSDFPLGVSNAFTPLPAAVTPLEGVVLAVIENE